MIYPMKTSPVFKQYIWGGNTLKTKFGKNVPDDFAAESWEISCHKDGLCTVAEGDYSGMLLRDVIASDPMSMTGKDEYTAFPLLVKILDATDRLSVQVHPDDAYAYEFENGEKGKTEMWYVIDAKPGAKLVYGLKEGTGKEQFRQAVESGNTEEVLNFVPVKKGDSFFIGSGTIHAIGAGLLIAEIQQSSNTTYRVYDYNRTDKNGNKRELHIEKAIAVTDIDAGEAQNRIGAEVDINGGKMRNLADCEFFRVEKYDLTSDTSLTNNHGGFEMLVFTEGSGSIDYAGSSWSFKNGDSFFVPAAIGKYTVSGGCTFLRSYIPQN